MSPSSLPSTRSIERSSAAPSVAAIAVTPREACRLLSLGGSRVYDLMKSGELVSYQDGRARRITVASIHAYVERQIAAAADSGGWVTWQHNPRRRKGGLLGNRTPPEAAAAAIENETAQ
jgi:excisionase family DNA binding protein